MKVHFIIHESFEAPAAIAQWAKQRQHEISFSHVYQGRLLPDSADAFDFLVVMGGPQSPSTSLEECPHFDAKKEIELIQDARDRQKLILGICLGAQLMGEAFGEKCERSPNREVGIFPIYLTDGAKSDHLFKHFPDEFSVGHWHGDMPGLPEDAIVLATSEGCPRQIIRFNERSYGFQCHLEFTRTAVSTLIQNNQQDLDISDALPYIQTSEVLLNHDYDLMNQLLFDFLDRFTTQ